MPTKTEYLTTIEAARYLNFSHRTLEKMRIQGDGPVFRKFGRRVLYKREDLEEWTESRKRRSTSDSGPLSDLRGGVRAAGRAVPPD